MLISCLALVYGQSFCFIIDIINLLDEQEKIPKDYDEHIHKHQSYYYTTNERCFALDRFLIWKQNILLYFLITEALNCRMYQPQSVGGCYSWIFKSFISNLWPLQCATPKKYFEWKTKNTAFRNTKRTWYDFLSKKTWKPSLTRQPNFVAEWRGSLVLDRNVCVWYFHFCCIKFGGAVLEMF